MASVGCELDFEVHVDSVLVLQIAALDAHQERLDVTGGSIEELATSGGGRMHVVRAAPGSLRVRYEATAAAMTPAPAPDPVDELAVVYGRQSRYCPSDAIVGFAERTFGESGTPAEVTAWVHDQLEYQSGSSDSLDTAVDTLLQGRGVCRDFAHLTVALCRALGHPARLVAVYAPGLEPMDFHAVAEVRVDGAWRVFDATGLAPVDTMVRICSGRDAADTSFSATLEGDVSLRWASVGAA